MDLESVASPIGIGLINLDRKTTRKSSVGNPHSELFFVLIFAFTVERAINCTTTNQGNTT